MNISSMKKDELKSLVEDLQFQLSCLKAENAVLNAELAEYQMEVMDKEDEEVLI